MKHRFFKYNKPYDLNLQTSFKNLFNGIGKILNLIVGISRKNLNEERSNKINELIDSDFTKRLVIKLNEDDNKFDYSILFPSKISKLSELQSNFDEKWRNESLVYEQLMFDQQIPEGEIKRKLSNLRNEKLFERISDVLVDDIEAKLEIINVLKAHLIYKKQEQKSIIEIDKEKEKLNNLIKSDSYIRSHTSEWFNNSLESELKPIREEKK